MQRASSSAVSLNSTFIEKPPVKFQEWASRKATMQPADQPQLLSLGKRDTQRLLEVYVKRSLSLNDGSAIGLRQGAKARKWTVKGERGDCVRRHSSDSSAHLSPGDMLNGALPFLQTPPESPFTATEPVTYVEPKDLEKSEDHVDQRGHAELENHIELINHAEEESHTELENHIEVEKKPKKSNKKGKKSSLLKSFLSLFSRKDTDEKEDRDSSPERMGTRTPPDTPSPSISCLPVSGPFSGGTQNSPRPGKSIKRRQSRKKFSFRNASDTKKPEKPTSLPLFSTVQKTEELVSVEPTSVYYEKVSEELARIVKEVKDSPTEESHITAFARIVDSGSAGAVKDEDVIEEIISLLKQQGDDINVKIQENGSLSTFFRTLSYSTFQQLADRYVQEEIPSRLPQDSGAPELVRFAFTLDFTAKVAGLSNQAVCRIMGFGNQYLQDRFTQMSRANLVESQAKALQNLNSPD